MNIDSQSELHGALRQSKSAFVSVAWLSALINILLLGGPLFMLLIYDSVMPSGSTASLFGLLVLIVIVYLFQGVFDILRGRILSEVAAGFDARLSGRIYQLMSFLSLTRETERTDGLTPMRDLESIRGFLSSPGPGALMDLPWLLLFIGLLSVLHIWLGLVTLAGALVLIGLTFLQERGTAKPSEAMSEARAQKSKLSQDNLRHADVIHSLGMKGVMYERWQMANAQVNQAQDTLTRGASLLSGIARVFRMFLQSLVLSVGALLYLAGEASGGIVFAASILAARALAPIDQAMAHWPRFTEARQGWERLSKALAIQPRAEASHTQLPAPQNSLQVEKLAIAAPQSGEALLEGIEFALVSGDALGVIGPSAAGKTTLAQSLVGILEPAFGSIRLDGASLDQWQTDALGKHLGYLPQHVELFDGTIAQNIARFEPGAPSEATIAAAMAAGVHDMVLQLPNGYDTQVGSSGTKLSSGQCQRIGLARALYREPFLLVLDEPNSNLDAEGEEALDKAIAAARERGAITVLVAHRPSALRRVNKVMVLQNGAMSAFGERDAILERLAKASNATPISAAHGQSEEPKLAEPQQ